MAPATRSRTVCCGCGIGEYQTLYWPGAGYGADIFVKGALQFLGNLFEYFLTRKNKGKEGKGMICRLVLFRLE